MEVSTNHINLFSVHENSLQLFLYYDDVEFCNPLGSKKQIHKLGECMCSVVHVIMHHFLLYIYNYIYILFFLITGIFYYTHLEI